MEVQSRMKCKWNLQSLHLRFGHSGMGLFQFQGSERCKLIGGDFQGGDAKTLRNWATVLRYFGRCKAWLSKAHWASTSKDQMVRARSADNFGAWGARHIFEQMRLEDLAYEFVLRAKEAIMKAGEEEGGEEVLAGAATGASARFRLRLVPLRVSWHSTLNWCHGAWEWPPRTWLWSTYITWPWASPISGLVDPSL